MVITSKPSNELKAARSLESKGNHEEKGDEPIDSRGLSLPREKSLPGLHAVVNQLRPILTAEGTRLLTRAFTQIFRVWIEPCIHVNATA